MSFRLFIYYCALCGAWAALLGWILGRFLSPAEPLLSDAVRGALLGLTVALGLGLVDCLWNLSWWHIGALAKRLGVGLLIGGVGGLLGGLIGSLLYTSTHVRIFFVLGWTL